MIIAGVTGTIGTGKSTVARMFAELGAFVIDHDRISREVVEPGKPAWQAILDFFGKGVLNDDRSINRQALADIVFKDPDKLQKLNSIVHPAVLNEDQRLVEERKRVDPDGLIIKDVPLLLEAGPEIAHLLVDKIIVVFASPDVQLKRLIARGVPEEDARNRIRTQLPVSNKIRYADFVVDNDGTLDDTMRQVKNIHSSLMDRSLK
ncbi:MAG: dephospho-CoA kinase [Dehalococcoidia bacterium]|nr:dephospho-CoA kinase [Dehalococcoidia bacterium]